MNGLGGRFGTRTYFSSDFFRPKKVFHLKRRSRWTNEFHTLIKPGLRLLMRMCFLWKRVSIQTSGHSMLVPLSSDFSSALKA